MLPVGIERPPCTDPEAQPSGAGRVWCHGAAGGDQADVARALRRGLRWPAPATTSQAGIFGGTRHWAAGETPAKPVQAASQPSRSATTLRSPGSGWSGRKGCSSANSGQLTGASSAAALSFSCTSCPAGSMPWHQREVFRRPAAGCRQLARFRLRYAMKTFLVQPGALPAAADPPQVAIGEWPAAVAGALQLGSKAAALGPARLRKNVQQSDPARRWSVRSSRLMPGPAGNSGPQVEAGRFAPASRLAGSRGAQACACR